MNIFGNNLTHLYYAYPPTVLVSIDFSNINFNKLEQMGLMVPSMKILNLMLKTEHYQTILSR